MSSHKTRHLALITAMALAVSVFPDSAFARWRDGTGPGGRGPLTGRGAGYCAVYSVPGYQINAVPRPGMGGAAFFRNGRGYRNRYNTIGLTRWKRGSTTTPTTPAQPAITREQHLEALKKQVEYLKKEMERITRQISDIQSE